MEACQLAELPKELLPKLPKLESWFLANNKLVELPPNMAKLRSLAYLDLSNNKIKTFPKNLKWLKRIKFLSLEGNPMSEEELERIKKVLPLEAVFLSDGEQGMKIDIKWD